MTPTISPFEAQKRCEESTDRNFQDGDFLYAITEWDGSPTAENLRTGDFFMVSGEYGDDITEASTWVN